MFGWFRKKTKVAKITEAVTTKVNLRPGEHLFITFKSDNIDFDDIASMRAQIGKAFPNNKVAIIVIGQDDNIKFSTINPLEEEKDGPTNG